MKESLSASFFIFFVKKHINYVIIILSIESRLYVDKYEMHNFGCLDPKLHFDSKVEALKEKVVKEMEADGYKVILVRKKFNWISHSKIVKCDWHDKFTFINIYRQDIKEEYNLLYLLLVEFYKIKYKINKAVEDALEPLCSPDGIDNVAMETIEHYFDGMLNEFPEWTIIWKVNSIKKRSNWVKGNGE